MKSALPKIDALIQQLRSLLPMQKEYQQKLDKKIKLEFNYNSNHIEGNTLTYGETELLLIFGQTKGPHDIREYDEMKAHNVAFEMIKSWAADKEHSLSEMDIKNLNQIILVEPFWKDAITPDGQTGKREIKIGNYKEHPNSVRLQNGELFEYASPMETPIQMGELIQWYRDEDEKKELHPVELAALLHYRFVRIHPFDDGNGRLSRLLLNYVLLKNDLPPIIIKSEDKKNYLNALHQADAGFISDFVEYIAQQFIWSLELNIKAAKGENIDEPGDFEKKLGQLKKKMNITNEVQVEKNEKAIVDSFEMSIFPLITTIEHKINALKKFFKYQTQSFNFFNDQKVHFAESINITSAQEILNLNGNVSEVTYTYKLSNLRQYNNKGNDIGFGMRIQFHQLVYDIEFIVINLKISKGYLEEISFEERDAIADKLGNYVIEQIEKATSD